MKNSQTSTEYLIILAVVIVISIIVISILGGIPSIGGGISKSSNDVNLRNQLIGIDKYAIDCSQTTLKLINNLPTSIRINNITINNTLCTNSMFNLNIGQQKTIYCTNFNKSDPDENYEVPIAITFTDLNTNSIYTLEDNKLIGKVASCSGTSSSSSSVVFDISFDSLNNLGGTSSDYPYSIIEGSDGYIVVGYSMSDLSGLTGGTASTGSRDFVIMKFDKTDLSLIALNNFGGTSEDYLYSITEGSDGYIVVGASRSDLSGFTGGSTTTGGEDFVIAKINKTDLSIITLNNFGGILNDYFYSVIEDDDGYVVGGYSRSDLSGLPGGTASAGTDDFVIAKINKTDLSLISLNNIGGTSNDYIYQIYEGSDGYIGVGDSWSDLSGLLGGSSASGYTDAVVVKFNKSDLSFIRLNNFGGTYKDYLYSVIEDDDGYVVGGYSESDFSGLPGGTASSGHEDFMIAKIDKTDLSIITLNNFGGGNEDYLYSLIEDDDGYVIGGYSRSDLSGLPGGTASAGTDDFVIAKINKTDLSLSEINNLGGSSSDYLSSIIKGSNGYIAAGRSTSDLSGLTGGSASTGDVDFVVSKFS